MSTTYLSSARVRSEFARELAVVSGTTLLSSMALETQTSTNGDVYPILSRVPMMRKKNGPPQLKQIEAKKVQAVHDWFDASERIASERVTQDETGQLLSRVREYGKEVQMMKYRNVMEIIRLNTALCYDGKVLLASDHVFGNSGSQTNLLTNTQVPKLRVVDADNPSPEELVEAVVGAANYMRGYKDSEGDYMFEDLKNFAVLFPQDLGGTFEIALRANTLAGGETNAVKAMESGGYRFIPQFAQRLFSSDTGNTVFYIVNLDSSNNKPFIIEEEIPARIDYIGAGSEFEQFNNEHAIIAKWRGGFLPGEPLRIAKCTLSQA